MKPNTLLGSQLGVLRLTHLREQVPEVALGTPVVAGEHPVQRIARVGGLHDVQCTLVFADRLAPGLGGADVLHQVDCARGVRGAHIGDDVDIVRPERVKMLLLCEVLPGHRVERDPVAGAQVQHGQQPRIYEELQTELVNQLPVTARIASVSLFVSDGHRWRHHLEFPMLG